MVSASVVEYSTIDTYNGTFPVDPIDFAGYDTSLQSVRNGRNAQAERIEAWRNGDIDTGNYILES